MAGGERGTILTASLSIRWKRSGTECEFSGSTQHLLAVYSQEFGTLKSFAGVDSSAALSCPGPTGYRATGQFAGQVLPQQPLIRKIVRLNSLNGAAFALNSCRHGMEPNMKLAACNGRLQHKLQSFKACAWLKAQGRNPAVSRVQLTNGPNRSQLGRRFTVACLVELDNAVSEFGIGCRSAGSFDPLVFIKGRNTF